jgi:hypothetical protein
VFYSCQNGGNEGQRRQGVEPYVLLPVALGVTVAFSLEATGMTERGENMAPMSKTMIGGDSEEERGGSSLIYQRSVCT